MTQKGKPVAMLRSLDDDSLAAFEEYKARRKDYTGAYEEYKKVDPYYMDVFEHTTMNVEVWKPLDREFWIE